MIKFLVAVLFASVAFGQEVDRTFKLTNVTTAPGSQEIATLLRTVADIRNVNAAVGTLTVKGTADQIATCEWLVPRLDVAVNTNGEQQYAVAGNANDLLLVYGLAHTATTTGIQEIITTVRTVADIQKLYNVSAPRIVAMRGNAAQVALFKFLLVELDRAVEPRQNATVHEYQVSPGGADSVVVYGLAHTATTIGIQEIITTLRTLADIQKIYNVSAPKILAMRGSASPMALAKFLLVELDQPAQPRQSPSVHEYQVSPGGSDSVVVYGLAHTPTSRDMQVLITTLRTVLDIQKVYTVSDPKLVAVRCIARGEPGLLKTVEWLIGELDRESANSGENLMRMPGGSDDVVRVFYLTHVTGQQGINTLLGSVRGTAHIAKAYESLTPPALVLRGTADMIVAAGRMIEAGDR